MPWPLVTRGTYDELMRLTERLQDDLRIAHECLAEAQRHAANSLTAMNRLTDMLVQKVLIDTPPVKIPMQLQPLQPLPVAQPDEVAQAIELAAGDNTQLARHLSKWSKQQKMEGAKEHDIIHSILHWHTGELPYE